LNVEVEFVEFGLKRKGTLSVAKLDIFRFELSFVHVVPFVPHAYEHRGHRSILLVLFADLRPSLTLDSQHLQRFTLIRALS